tara:strand:- start:381 stop:971 length:591 start_codon:yes stop_codon:yes gene_type:complete
MYRVVVIIFLLFYSNILIGQINYYVGFDLLSTNSKVIENNNENNQNSINFSTYIGNEINLNNKFKVFIDVVYQNNKNILKQLEDQDTRFELHQTISLLLKPSFKFNNNTIGPIIGVSGVYVFDKKEDTGEQIDRFDEGYLFGVNLNKNLTSKVSVNFSLLYNIFESISHYTHTELVNYTTMTIGVQYNLYGSNFQN